MSVVYEWDCETVADGDSEEHEDGEVIDHSHGASYKEVVAWSAANVPQNGTRHAIVLVRDDDDRRAWAYVEGGRLPDKFTDADGREYAKVPQKFHAEVQRA